MLSLVVLVALPRAAEAGPAPKVVILPFAVSGALEFESVGPFVPSMLSSRMHGLGSFYFVNTIPTGEGGPDSGSGTLTPEAAGVLARRLGADYLISGTLRRSGGITAFNAQLHRGNGGLVGDRVIVPVNGPDDLFPKLEPLAEALASRLKSAEASAAAAEAPPAPE
jgi:hypothetical protein